MASCNSEVLRATDNKLFTLKGRKLPDGSQQILLMGFIEMKKRVDGTVGWILVISGNPLIPHENGDEFPNKIGLDKLHVTWNQREAILESSILPDGYVYLYGGKFRVGHCQNSGNCDQHNSSLFNLLGDKLNRFEVTMDTERVVPFRRSLIERITMHTEGIHTFGEIFPNTDIPANEMQSDNEKFIFWGNEEQSSVEIECPIKHAGYFVEVYLLQRHIYKCKVKDSCRPRRETNVLEHDTVLVKPSCNEKGCISCGHDDDEMKRVQITLKIFGLPEPGEEIHPEGILEKYRVKRVEYWGVARLLKDGDWKEMTVAKLLVRKPVKVAEPRKPASGKKSASAGYHIYQNVMANSEGDDVASNSSIVESSGIEKCCISVNILILELELFGGIKV